MRNFARESETLPEGLEEAVQRAFLVPPAPDAERRHRATIAATIEEAARTAAPRPTPSVTALGRGRAGRISRAASLARLAAAAGAAVLAVPLALAGLASAGVSLPAPANSAFEAVGIELPNQGGTERAGERRRPVENRPPAIDDRGRVGRIDPASTPARFCAAERTAIGVDVFRETYGNNENDRNAFGRCVSDKAKAQSEEKSKGKAGGSRGSGQGKGPGKPSGLPGQADGQPPASAGGGAPPHSQQGGGGRPDHSRDDSIRPPPQSQGQGKPTAPGTQGPPTGRGDPIPPASKNPNEPPPQAGSKETRYATP